MDSSPVSPHVCELDASPDIHNPSPCDLYRRMVMQEQLVMESTQRSKRRSLVRRGWARVKVTVTKWVDGMNEAREARRLSQTSLNSPLARATCGCSSTSHLTHPSSSTSTLIDPFAEPMSRIESSSIVRIVSHKSLVTPSLVGTSLAAAHSCSPTPPATRPRGGTSVSQPPSIRIPTITEGSPTPTNPPSIKEGRGMSTPNLGVQVKTFRRMSLVDGEEIFEEIRPGSGEKKVDFVWGKGVDESIPPVVVNLAVGQEERRRWRKLSLSKASTRIGVNKGALWRPGRGALIACF